MTELNHDKNDVIYVSPFIVFSFLFLGEAVIPKRGKYPAMKIFQRFHFSSALKRMSVIAGYSNPGSSETHYLACVKVLFH